MTPAPPPFRVWLPRILLVLLGLHFARGVLPFTPVEGDESGVVNGLQAWSRGTNDFADAAYSYPIQPGSYHLLRLLSAVTRADELAVFGATTALAVAGFVVLASLLLARAGGLRPAWVGVALLLTQEITAAACYANTNAIAGVVLMAGLLVAQRAERRTGLWSAGLLIGVAGWLRMDSLLLSPVVLALRLARQPDGRAARETSEVAVASGLALLAACTACGLSLADSWREFMGRDNYSDWGMLRVNGWLTLGYAATAASVIGAGWLCFQRRWQVLCLVALGCALTLAIYGGSFASPKYFYYTAPFMLLPGLSLVAGLLDSARILRRVLAGGLITLHLSEALLGIQTASEFRRFDPAPPWPAFGPVPLAGRSITIGPSEGEIIPTVDGPRLRGGQFWAPQLWAREKTAMQRETARLAGWLADAPPDVLLTSTYLAFAVTDGWLRAHGYKIGAREPFPGNPSSFTADCEGPAHHLTLAHINHTANDAREFAAWTKPGRRILFVNDRGALDFRRLAASPGDWRLLSARCNGLLALYEYQPH